MSTALEAASLIMIPTSYSDGLLASVKPNDGAGDFTFTRGSNISATRVNEDGYIEKGYENLLPQSNSFDATWGLTNTAVTSSQTGYDGSSDAWLLTKTNDGGFIFQNSSVSDINTFSIYAKANTLSHLLIYIRASNDGKYFDLVNGTIGSDFRGAPIDATIESVGNGWYRCSITTINAADNIRVYPADADGDISGTSGSIYIQDAILNQGLVAYPYVETTTAPVARGILEDMPRIDFSGGNQSLLLEPSRTNLIVQSESSAGWNYTSPISVTSNSSISPEGVNNATKITKVADGNMYYRIYTTFVIGCFSVFAKKGNWRYIGLRNNQAAGNDHSVFDFDTQTFVKEASGQTCTFEDYGNGWYRLNSYQPNNEANGLYGIALTDENGAENSAASPVPNGSYLYVYGFQLEQNATYPTSYIPTYGVSQTRLADVCSKDNISGLINSPDGVFYNEVFLESTPLTGNRHLIVRGDASNYVNVYFDTIGSIVARIKVAGVDTFLATPITQVQNKVAILWQANKYALFVNGVKAAENLSGATFPAGTLNKIDFDNVNSNTPFYGEVKQTLLFPTALSDEECITLTTI